MSLRSQSLLVLIAFVSLLESSARGEALPPGVLARLGSTRFRVGDANGCLAISPDGKVLATGGGSSVRLWDRTTREQLWAVRLPVIDVFSVTFSPDGKYVAALGDVVDNSLFVVEVANGNILHRFRGRHSTLVFSPDKVHLFTSGGRFVVPDNEEPVFMWDIASGKQRRKFPGVLSYALSPDGKLLAGGDRKGIVYLWDAKSGEERKRLRGHGDPILELAFSPDGRTLISASGVSDRISSLAVREIQNNPDNSVRLWDVDSGKERLPPCRHSQTIQSLRFAPDSKTFASSDRRGNLYLRDAKTGRLRQLFPGDYRAGSFIEYSPDGKYLLYCDQPVRIHGRNEFYQWDIAAGKERCHWESPEPDLTKYLFSPDGKTLFSLGASIRAWDFATGEERHAELNHRAAIQTMLFSGDGKSLATLDTHHRLRVWDVAQYKAISSLDTPKILRCAFAPDGRSLLTVANDACVSVREVPSGRLVRRFRVGTPLTLGLWTIITNSHAVRDLDLSLHPNDCCVFDRERRLLAVADNDQAIHLWDVTHGKELRRLEGHRGTICDLRFSTDGRWLFSSGMDNTIRWWDVANGMEIQRFQVEGAESLHYALSDDNRLLAWVGNEQIYLWDLSARKEVRSFKGHSGGTTKIRLEREGAVLVSTGADRAIRCWDTKTGQEIRAVKGGEYERRNMNLLAAPAGPVLVLASMDAKNNEYALYHAATGREISRTRTYEAQKIGLSVDGKTVVVSDEDLVFHETAGGGVVARVPTNHRGRITCLTFSPDGKVLATGGEDTMVLLLDWQRLTGLAKPDAVTVGDKEMETLWTDLASTDASKAYRALGSLTTAGDKSVSLLRRRLAATVAVRASWQKWLAELDHNDFAVREKASQELTRLGVEAYFFLRRASAEKVPLETRRRLQQILSGAEMKRPSNKSLRAIRAVQLLETIGTPAARELLADWSHGDVDAWLTQEARSALRRLRADSLLLGRGR